MVVGAVPRPFDERPEAFNRVRMQPAIGVLLLVVDDGMGQAGIHRPVARIFVRQEQRVVEVQHVLEELHETLASQGRGDLGHDLSASLNRTDDGRFLGPAPGRARRVVVLAVRTPRLATDIRLIGFNQPAQQAVALGHRCPDPLLHVPGRALVQVEVAPQLVAAQALLGV